MTKEQVLRAFCELARQVNREVFEFSVPSDCFCTDKSKVLDPLGIRFEFNPEVLTFIQQAVGEKLRSL